ncbi:protein charybde-like [Atheta coriaria]|uniref:protein charybde-like n=1 Tax=Dalotia coriaria TaxID=877792 RepID=UPI0031F461F8
MEVLNISNVDYNNQEAWSYDSDPFTDDEGECAKTINALADRLVEELKNAKRDHFSSGEVLLPAGLLQRISRDILAEAEREPCGLRGCTLYLRFKGEEAAREITLGTVKFDRATASTFEVTLLLKQSTAGWNFFLPQFLKKITRGGTVMIDADYKLQKNKLYRSYCD